ncbi:haloalkane dehalogenase [Olea europaea subsp. europaea]|uniref:Haloalkane dehalogenase n=1 Tax=Olea europaea subsp. europaea TaxID=158383 RepID=A0A8S0TGD0_OLEEU|nr:haloalkane dehalogenase [Olea europaea subsp. europaea]
MPLSLSLLTSPPTPAPRNLRTFSSASSSHLTTTRFLASKRFRTTISIVARVSEEGDDKPAFNTFGFVTDNPSIRSYIQLPESPAEDENVGQMLFKIEDKGKLYGSYIKAGGFRWFVRETGSIESGRGTIVFLHGAPMQSYSYRVVKSQMAFAGFHCFAPDWIGFGFNDKPQAGYGFDYTGWSLFFDRNSFMKLLVLGVASPFFLVVQTGLPFSSSFSNVSKSIISLFNIKDKTNLPVENIPWRKIPLLCEFTCQNAVMAGRFIEAAMP